MKQIGCFKNRLLVCGLALLATGLLGDLQAQAMKEGKAVVRAIRGSAKYSTGGGVWVPLKVGTTLKSGAVVQTAADSTVDLFLGQNGPVVRVTPDTTMGFDKLAYSDTGADNMIETQLNLQSGTILGNVKKLAAASKYEIRMPNGVAGIRGTDYKVTVRPVGGGRYAIEVTSVTGTLVAAAVVDGRTVTGVVNTGETWTPESGVKPAPEDLIRFASSQIQESMRTGGDVAGMIGTTATPPLIDFVAPLTGTPTAPTPPQVSPFFPVE